MAIDSSKQYRTQDGRAVKILMTNAGGPYAVIAAVYHRMDEAWYPETYTAAGKYHLGGEEGRSPMDLVELPAQPPMFHYIDEDGDTLEIDVFDSMPVIHIQPKYSGDWYSVLVPDDQLDAFLNWFQQYCEWKAQQQE